MTLRFRTLDGTNTVSCKLNFTVATKPERPSRSYFEDAQGDNYRGENHYLSIAITETVLAEIDNWILTNNFIFFFTILELEKNGIPGLYENVF